MGISREGANFSPHTTPRQKLSVVFLGRSFTKRTATRSSVRLLPPPTLMGVADTGMQHLGEFQQPRVQGSAEDGAAERVSCPKQGEKTDTSLRLFPRLETDLPIVLETVLSYQRNQSSRRAVCRAVHMTRFRQGIFAVVLRRTVRPFGQASRNVR